MSVELVAGDIFFTRGTSFMSRMIRVFTRSKHERPTMVNHTGLIVTNGTMTQVKTVEALSKVRKRKLTNYAGGKTQVAVYRKKDLTVVDRSRIISQANSYVGRDYGYVKIVAHFLDWCLGGAYIFRRMASMDKYPICSWVVACAYEKARIDFGVPSWTASPDDIWDFVVESDEWECVIPLRTIPAVAS
jgi:hypothetical protein